MKKPVGILIICERNLKYVCPIVWPLFNTAIAYLSSTKAPSLTSGSLVDIDPISAFHSLQL